MAERDAPGITEYTYTDEEGLVTVGPPSDAGGPYQGVVNYDFSDAEGTVIVADPPSSSGPYQSVTDATEYTYGDAEGLTIVAAPQRGSSTALGRLFFFDEEVILGRLPRRPYEGLLDTPKIRWPEPEDTQGLTTLHRRLLAEPRVPSDKVGAFNTRDAVQAQVERFRSSNGTSRFLADYKDRWVRANRNVISAAARRYDIPAWLLAGVAWTEVGGDPPFLDELAENFRLNPNRTSFGPVQIEIYRAAQELGYDPDKLSPAQRRALIWTLLDPQSDLFVVASHLRRLKDIDVPWKSGAQLTDDDVRLIGARYNRGAELSRHALENLGLRTSYGDNLVRRKQRSVDLLK